MPPSKSVVWNYLKCLADDNTVKCNLSKKRRVDFYPNFNSSLEIIVKGVTMAKLRHMYGTKVPNFIGL